MSPRLQNFEENLKILNIQMDVLTRFVGYLTSYTVADEHVKDYIRDKHKKCRIEEPNESLEDKQKRISSKVIWERIFEQL